ncbi:MAG: hypothetical protein ABMA13_21330 [Chthoniobacteraceae bacterium]
MNATGGNLVLTSVTAGGTGRNLTATTTTSGNISIDNVSAASDVITLTAAGSIEESGADGGADITAASASLSGATGIGASGTIEIDLTTLTSATTTGAAASINLSDVAGGLSVTSATTSDAAITLNATGGTLVLTTVTAGGTSRNITVTTTTSGDIQVDNVTAAGDVITLTSAGSIEESGADAGADITAASASLSGATGIGASATIEIDLTTLTSAATTGANASIDLIDLSGGLSVTSATATDGAIALAAIAGNLTVTTATAGGTGRNIALTTTTSGNVLVDNVTAAGDVVTITSAGAINESGADAGADITAASASLSASTGIGSGGTIELDLTTLTSATTTSANGTIDLSDLSGGLGVTNATTTDGLITLTAIGGDLVLTTVTAGGSGRNITAATTTSGNILIDNVSAAGDVITLTSAGSIEESGGDGGADLTATSASLSAATGIGASGAIEIDLTTLTSATTTGSNAAINLSDLSGGLNVTSATTTDGAITLATVGGDLSLTTVTAGGTGRNVTGTTTTSGSILIDNVTASGDDVTLTAAGAISESGADAGADITSATASLSGATGIGASGTIEIDLTTLTSATTTGAGASIDLSDLAGGLSVTNASTSDAAITLNTIAGDLTLTSATAGGAGRNITVTTTTSGNVLVGNVTAADDVMTITSAGSIEESGADAGADITAGSASLSAATGIGASGTVEIDFTTLTSATTTGANASIDLSDVAGGLSVTSATTTNGAITLGAIGGDLVLTTITAGGTGRNITASTTTSGNLIVDVVTATGDTITITSAGAISEAGAGDAGAEFTATNGSLSAVDGIGASALIEINFTTLTSATVSGTGAINLTDLGGGLVVTAASTNDGAIALTANNGNLTLGTITAGGTGRNLVAITSGSGNILVDNLSAAGDDITLTAVGAINESGADAGTDLTAATATLTAASGIGNLATIEIDLTTLTSATVSGAGAINLSDAAGGLSVTTATTGDGAITLEAISGNLALATIIAGGTGRNIAATTTTSGNLSFDNLTAAGDTITLSSAGSIEESVADGGADITATTLSITAGTNVGALSAIETAVIGFNAAVSGAIIVTNTGSLTTGALTSTSGTILLTNSSDIALNGNVTTTGNVSLLVTSGGITRTSGTISGDDVTLSAPTGALGASGAPIVLAATNLNTNTSSGGNQYLSEADAVEWNTSSAGAGLITLVSGQFDVAASETITSTLITVSSGATLGGSGTTGAATVQSGGSVAPGAGTEILYVGDVTFAAGASFSVAVNGSLTPGTDYDQLSVTGTVDLGGATLVTTGTVTSANTEIVLIDNDGGDAVIGTFAGLAEGATVTINSVAFILSYVGGTNSNDVVLNAPTTSVTLSAGDLIVTDINGATTNDALTFTLNGTNVRVSDPTNLLLAGPGTTQVSLYIVDVPLASITGNIQALTFGGNDRLTVDLSFGNFIPSGGLIYDGGTGTTDLLRVIGDATDDTATVAPSASTTGDSSITVDIGGGTRTITTTSVDSDDITGMVSATLDLTSAGNTIGIVSGFAYFNGAQRALIASGTTNGGTTIQNVAFYNNTTATILVSAAGSNDAITVNSASGLHGNSNFTINAGTTGTDSLDLLGETVVGDSVSFTLHGAITQDSLAAITTDSLTTVSFGAQTLTSESNVIGAFAATNTAAGTDIELNNAITTPFTLGAVTNAGGAVTIDNSFGAGAVDTTITGTIASGGTAAGDINITTTGTLTVQGVVNSGTGSPGVLEFHGAVDLQASPVLGAGDIILTGGAGNLRIAAPLVFATSFTLTTEKNIIIEATVSATGSTSNLTILADNDGDGEGGIYVKEDGFVSAGRDLTMTGALLTPEVGITETDQAIRIDAEGDLITRVIQVQAVRNITMNVSTLTPDTVIAIAGYIANTNTGTTIGNIEFNANGVGTTQIIDNTATVAAGGTGSILFDTALDSTDNYSVRLSTPLGNINFLDAVGANGPLGDIEIPIARNVTAFSTLAARSITVTSALDTVTFTGAVTTTATSGNDSMSIVAPTMVVNAVTAGAGDVLWEVNTLAMGGVVGGSGDITIRPILTSRSIGINGTGDLNLDSTEINYLQAGFNLITIGRTNGSGTINVGGADFHDTLTVLTPNGTMNINGKLATTDIGSGINIKARTLNLNVNSAGDDVIATEAGPITILNTNIVLLTASKINSNRLDSIGGDITINATINGAHAFEVDALNDATGGTVHFGGLAGAGVSIGGSVRPTSFTVSANDISTQPHTYTNGPQVYNAAGVITAYGSSWDTLKNGDVTVNGTLSLVANLRVTASNIAFNGTVDNSAANGGGALSLSTPGTIHFAGNVGGSLPLSTIVVLDYKATPTLITVDGLFQAGNAITLMAGEIDFNGGADSVNGSTLTIYPASDTQTVNLGVDVETPGSAAMELNSDDIDAIGSGITKVLIGREFAKGTLAVVDEVTFKSSTVLRVATSGTTPLIDVNAPLHAIGTASLTLVGVTVDLGANVDTAAGALTINTSNASHAINVTAPITVSSTSGAITFFAKTTLGDDLTVTTNSGAMLFSSSLVLGGDLVLNSNTGNIAVGGAVLSPSSKDLTINATSGNVSFSSVIGNGSATQRPDRVLINNGGTTTLRRVDANSFYTDAPGVTVFKSSKYALTNNGVTTWDPLGIEINDPLSVGISTTLVAKGIGNVEINSTVDSPTSLYSLTVKSVSGNIGLHDAVGSVSPLKGLTITSTSGDITVDESVDLIAGMTATTTSGDVTLDGAVTSSALTVRGVTIQVNSPVTTTGAQSYTGTTLVELDDVTAGTTLTASALNVANTGAWSVTGRATLKSTSTLATDSVSVTGAGNSFGSLVVSGREATIEVDGDLLIAGGKVSRVTGGSAGLTTLTSFGGDIIQTGAFETWTLIATASVGTVNFSTGNLRVSRLGEITAMDDVIIVRGAPSTLVIEDDITSTTGQIILVADYGTSGANLRNDAGTNPLHAATRFLIYAYDQSVSLPLLSGISATTLQPIGARYSTLPAAAGNPLNIVGSKLIFARL